MEVPVATEPQEFLKSCYVWVAQSPHDQIPWWKELLGTPGHKTVQSSWALQGLLKSLIPSRKVLQNAINNNKNLDKRWSTCFHVLQYGFFPLSTEDRKKLPPPFLWVKKKKKCFCYYSTSTFQYFVQGLYISWSVLLYQDKISENTWRNNKYLAVLEVPHISGS